MCLSYTIPYKELFEQVIDSALEKIAQSKTKSMITHFVYAGYFYLDFKTMHDQMIPLSREGMKNIK